MDPRELGNKYDRIARWWQDRHNDSRYGVAQVERALQYSDVEKGCALDVGCGAGGRLVRAVNARGLTVSGIDVSREMIALAQANHPDQQFEVADICNWQSSAQFDFIVAWDSIFHLPLAQQKPVLIKLTNLLNQGGVLIYTFGDAVGEHTDRWHDDTFYYSSIGIEENVKILFGNGLKVVHLERDQHPERHVYIIAQREG
ncbi:MAG: class I SAM-dependent methyltransferase [Pseudomonadota bacterium]